MQLHSGYNTVATKLWLCFVDSEVEGSVGSECTIQHAPDTLELQHLDNLTSVADSSHK